ncbi:MAG: MFS transporter, partial [Terriglobia bacterium]
YGFMGATYSAFQLVGAPILGRWSDSYGRKKILLLSQAGTLASWTVFVAAFFLPSHSLVRVESEWLGAFGLTLPLLVMFLARATDGLTGGNISVANAYLADVSGEGQRSANFGKMAVSTNLGFILGPALAGLLGATAWGELLPVLAALLISLVATLLIAVKLPESKPCLMRSDPEHTNVRKVFGQEHKECFEMKGAAKLSLREILGLRTVPYLMVIYFLVMLGFNFFYIAFPVYAVTGLRWSVVDIGIFFSVLGLLMVIAQGPVLSRASKRFSDAVLVVSGSFVLAAGFVCFASRSYAVVYLGAVLLALGNGLMWPSVLSMLSKTAGADYQGAVQGFAGSSGAVASIVGLVIGGILYGFLEAWIFVLSAAIIFAVFALSFRLPALARRNPVR